MSFTTAWLWTLLRSLLLMWLAWGCAGGVVQWIRRSPPGWRRWLLGILTAPCLFPELLTGYAYSQMTRLLITDWGMREAWFDLLLFLRVVPIGTLLWYFAPASPLSREAWYVRRLAFRPEDSTLTRMSVGCWYWIQGPARAGLIAASGLFLVLFQEFELASLLATTSWTVWLFDAQPGGLPLSESLQLCVPPAICTWFICGALPWLLTGTPLRSANQSAMSVPAPLRWHVAGGGYLILALGLLVGYPAFLLGGETWAGLRALAANSVQSQGLLQGILFAAGSALMSAVSADLLANWILDARPGARWKPWALVTSGLGLSGSLIVSLVTVAVFQLSWLRPLYDTALPLVGAQIVWLLPRALLLQGVLRAIRSPVQEHAARLLSAAGDSGRATAAREILWILRGRNTIAVRLVLCYWAYLELTLQKILSPAGLVSAPVRLYIDMHFSRNALLTAKASVTLMAPLLLIGLCWLWIKRLSESAPHRETLETSNNHHQVSAVTPPWQNTD